MGREDDGAMSILSVSLSSEPPTCTGWCENIYLAMTMIFFPGTLYSALDVVERTDIIKYFISRATALPRDNSSSMNSLLMIQQISSASISTPTFMAYFIPDLTMH